MKINNKPFLSKLLAGLVLFLLFPVSVFALSADFSQHFSNSCPGSAFATVGGTSTGGWTIGSSTGHYVIANGSGLAANDTIDTCSPAFYACFYSTAAGPSSSDAITITYTDPSPSLPNPNFIKLDMYDSSSGGNAVQVIVTDTHGGTATSNGNNIIPNCLTNNPTPTGGTGTDPVPWNTAYCDVTSLTSFPIQTVQFIFAGNADFTNPNVVGNPIYLDNLRGDALVSCFTATPTASPTPTGSFTPTPSNTPTNTNTFSPTNTVGNTATNTATFTNTPTQFTPTNTATKTPTPTITFTLAPTNSPTITSTPTPAPCQVEVYPNPMDFTISHNLFGVQGGACPSNDCIVFSCLPLQATLKIYTVSLALVRSFPAGSVVTSTNLPAGVGLIAWDGTNGNAAYVSSGLYFYVVNGGGVNTFGKFAISKSIHGP